MPLVKCAECQEPVSTTCPNCGASVKYKPSFSFVLVVLIVIGLIAAGVISVFIEIQKARRAEAEFNDVTRGVAVYSRIFSTPSPAESPRGVVDWLQQKANGASMSLDLSSASALNRPTL